MSRVAQLESDGAELKSRQAGSGVCVYPLTKLPLPTTSRGETVSGHPATPSRPHIHYVSAQELPEGKSLPLAAQQRLHLLVDQGNHRLLSAAASQLMWNSHRVRQIRWGTGMWGAAARPDGQTGPAAQIHQQHPGQKPRLAAALPLPCAPKMPGDLDTFVGGTSPCRNETGLGLVREDECAKGLAVLPGVNFRPSPRRHSAQLLPSCCSPPEAGFLPSRVLWVGARPDRDRKG